MNIHFKIQDKTKEKNLKEKFKKYKLMLHKINNRSTIVSEYIYMSNLQVTKLRITVKKRKLIK